MTSYGSKLEDLRARVNNHVVVRHADPAVPAVLSTPAVPTPTKIKNIAWASLIYLIAPAVILIALLLWKPGIIKTTSTIEKMSVSKVSAPRVVAVVAVASLAIDVGIYFATL
jgi:hypothetical protein